MTHAPVRDRLRAFVAERFPFAMSIVAATFEGLSADRQLESPAEIEAVRPLLRQALQSVLPRSAEASTLETTPRVSLASRMQTAHDELVDACDGLLCREAIARGLTPAERREILRGML